MRKPGPRKRKARALESQRSFARWRRNQRRGAPVFHGIAANLIAACEIRAGWQVMIDTAGLAHPTLREVSLVGGRGPCVPHGLMDCIVHDHTEEHLAALRPVMLAIGRRLAVDRESRVMDALLGPASSTLARVDYPHNDAAAGDA